MWAGLAQLGRTTLLGVTYAYTLQGLASAGQPVQGRAAAVALLGATAFHLAVYAWNDVADLAIDRTEPRRSASPLVRGTLSPRQVTAGAAVAAALALTAAATVGATALAAMAAALALLQAYNAWGKRAAAPPLTDLVQGLGWAALVGFGAAVAGGLTPTTAWLAAVVVVQILQVNGVLGALRDLANDSRHGARTTAILFGAHVADDGAPSVPAALRWYGITLHLVQVAALLAGLAATGMASPWRAGAVVVVGAACLGLLLRGLAAAGRPAVSWTAGLGYILGMLALPTLLVLDHLGPALGFGLLVLFVAPWTANRWLRGTVRAAVAARRRDRARTVRAVADLFRLRTVVSGVILCLLGAHLAGPVPHVGRLAAVTVGIALAIAFAQVVNDVYDVEVDRLHKPHRPLVAGAVSMRAARALAWGTAGGALLAGAVTGPVGLAGAVLLVGASWGYSLRLKDTPVMGNLVVATLASTPVLAGAWAAGGVTPLVIAVQAVVAVFMTAFELVKTGRDAAADGAAGLRTVATRFGTSTTAFLAAAACATFAVAAVLPAVLADRPVPYAAVMGAGAVLPALVCAVLLVRGSRSEDPFTPLRRILGLAWVAGVGSLVLL